MVCAKGLCCAVDGLVYVGYSVLWCDVDLWIGVHFFLLRFFSCVVFERRMAGEGEYGTIAQKLVR